MRHAHSDAYCNGDSYLNAISQSDADGNVHRYANADRTTDCHAFIRGHTDSNSANAHSYADGDGAAHTDAKDCPNPEAASNPAATPVSFTYEKEPQCSTPTSSPEHARNIGGRFFEPSKSTGLCCRVFVPRRNATGFFPI